jgi:hypothetical protein
VSWPFFAALGPVPTIPGGWGLRNPKPKEPGQRSAVFLAIQRGRRLAEKGLYCDSANDPVTAPIGRLAAFGAHICAKGTLAEATG